MNTVITNVRIITMNPGGDIIDDGYVSFSDSVIKEIGLMTDYIQNDDDEIIDGQRGILLPGMINLHTHLGMIPFRGLQDDCQDRLRRFLLPMEAKFMTKRLAALSTRYAICELISAGVTTFFDMYFYENEIGNEIEKTGIRGFLGETVMEADYSSPSGGQKAYANLQDLPVFLERWQNHPLIKPAIAPHGTNTCSEKTLKECHRLSQVYQVPLTIHVAEMDYEMDYFKRAYHMTPVEFLDSIGILDDRTIAAHCIHLSNQDFDILQKRRVNVAHCLGSNTKAAKGVAPVKGMTENGINVGLGTDGPASGNTLDMITQLKLFANFHKNREQDRSAFPAGEILPYTTINSAKALHMEREIGSIEVGKQADLVLLETRSVNMFPVYDPCSTVVYSANASNVDTVFVAGKCLLKNKRLTTLDVQAVREELEAEMINISFGEGFI